MSVQEDWDDDQEPYDDYLDDDPRDDYPEPDGSDYEEEKAYYEEAEHRDTAHGGGECDCRPTPAERLAMIWGRAVCLVLNLRYRVHVAAQSPRTVRFGRLEVTLRWTRPRPCDACSGRGWFYIMTARPDFPAPDGYNSAALCGCGSAIGALADTRRKMREWDRMPPF